MKNSSNNDDTNAMTDVDDRLATLARATASVRPRADFTARVMAATANAKVNASAQRRVGGLGAGLWDDLPRIARRLVPVAALAAALGVAWGVTNDDMVDDALAGSYGATELEW